MVFDDVIINMVSNKKLHPLVTELIISGRKLNMSFVFMAHSYFSVPKNVKRNTTHFFIMKIKSKRKLYQIAYNHLFDAEFNEFKKL